MKNIRNIYVKLNQKLISKLVFALTMFVFSSAAFATTTLNTNTNPSNFDGLTANIQTLGFNVLTIVQVVVTLAGILLVFRGVVHLKQNAHGSPQEKHLPKGIACIVFAAILFLVVPILHMFVGTLSSGIKGSAASANTWKTSSAGYAQGLTNSAKK